MSWSVLFFFSASWIAAVWGRRRSNKWDFDSISSHMNEIKGPARCPHYVCSSNFWNMLFPCCKHRRLCVRKKLWNKTLMIEWTDEISWHRTIQCTQSYLSFYRTVALNVNLLWRTAECLNCKYISKKGMFVLSCNFSSVLYQKT